MHYTGLVTFCKGILRLSSNSKSEEKEDGLGLKIEKQAREFLLGVIVGQPPKAINKIRKEIVEVH